MPECIRYHSTRLQRFSELQVDPLTAVGNRRALEGVVAAQFTVLKRYGTPFSLAVIDIDHFKELNDERGHLCGDEALRGLAKALVASVRTVDVVTRFGGDEFVVVMPHTDLHKAGMVADRLRERVGQTMPFSVSVGVASADAADTPEILFEKADTALYRAKTDGRNRMQCHIGPLDETVTAITLRCWSRTICRFPWQKGCRRPERKMTVNGTMRIGREGDAFANLPSASVSPACRGRLSAQRGAATEVSPRGGCHSGQRP